MKFTRILPTTCLLFVACGGKAAVEDLEKLKDKACSCAKDDQGCIDEAKKQAQEWVEKHKNARGGDQEKAEKLMMELLSCNMDVAMVMTKE